MMIDLAKIVVHIRQEREQEEQKEREAELRRQEEERLRQRQLEEQKCIEHLEDLFSQWVKAEQIREFLSLVETLPGTLAPVGMEKTEWLSWERGYVDTIDPLSCATRFE
jgi:predicted RNase H-like nuclease (RuvC/YqgF family)